MIWREVRLTLAVRYVLPEENPLAILQHLLARLKALNFSFAVLYLDKGFANASIITSGVITVGLVLNVVIAYCRRSGLKPVPLILLFVSACWAWL